MIAEPVICAAGWASARVTHFLAPVAVLMAMMSAPNCVPMTSVDPGRGFGGLRGVDACWLYPPLPNPQVRANREGSLWQQQGECLTRIVMHPEQISDCR